MKKMLQIALTVLRESFWITIAVGCVYGGYLGFQYLGDNKKVVEISPAERPIALVETLDVELFDQPLPVRAEGFIRPFRQVSLSAPSGGRIAALHPAILNLGTFSKGDVLVQLENSSERASLSQTVANSEATLARLELVQAQRVRTEELRERGVASQQALDQILGQEAEISASLNALIAAQASARIAVDNKSIIAPFNGAVLEKVLEVGSVVGSGQSVAEIYTHKKMEVVIPVREAEAALIPGLFGEGVATARVTVDFAGQAYQWPASVTRIDPALDPKTRTLSVSVGLHEIDNPLLLNSNTIATGNPPALINAFAKVEVQGVLLKDTYAVPSIAIRSGDQIWVFDNDEGDRGTLKTVDVTPVHVDGETTYVTVENWPQGLRLIRTSLAASTPGMALRDISIATLANGGME